MYVYMYEWSEQYNGLSEQWAVGIMGCRNNGSSELWAVGIMTRNPRGQSVHTAALIRPSD